MGPYRTPAVPPEDPPPRTTPSEDTGFAWVFIAVGGGRVAQALVLGESWGAEATLLLGVLILGLAELYRTLTLHWSVS